MRMSSEEIRELNAIASSLSVDLGAPMAPGADASREQDACSVNHNQEALAAAKQGHKMYNFNQLVEALVGSDPPVRAWLPPVSESRIIALWRSTSISVSSAKHC